MNKNEKGFSAVETIFIILIIGVITFIGYYVYQVNKKVPEVSRPVIQSTTNTSSDTPTYSYEGWKSYSAYGLTYKYPADWILTEANPEKDVGLGIASPDFLIDENDVDHTRSGSDIFISSKENKDGLTADSYKEKFSRSNAFKDFKLITINGNKAVQFNTIDDSLVITVFFLKNNTMANFSLRYSLDEYSTQLQTYNQIINSVTLD